MTAEKKHERDQSCDAWQIFHLRPPLVFIPSDDSYILGEALGENVLGYINLVIIHSLPSPTQTMRS
jgi:hypothetical protein